MKTRWIKLNERLRTSLWYIPAISTVLAVLLSSLLVELDRATGWGLPGVPWIFHGGADSARAVLSIIASSVITVAGTVYSIVIVVLTLASVQFAPRVLRSFMRDRSNQVVLGFFVATFTYCLLVLRSVTGTDEDNFVPGTAVAGGVVLGLLSLGMLIYFIDHIAHGIQVSNIIATVAAETIEQINYLYPQTWQEMDKPADHTHPELAEFTEWAPVPSLQSGYLQYIDYDSLLALATGSDLVVREDRLMGAFIHAGTALAYAAPRERVSDELCRSINRAFVLGSQPTLQQDIAFGIRQIVDISLKAISPAVNDPTTALNCIDHLGVILVTLATRDLPELDRYDSAGRLRIMVHERSFHDLVRLAFDQLRHFGSKDPIIVMRMLDTIAHVANVARNPEYREVLARYLERIVVAAEREIEDPFEIEAVRVHVQTAREAVEGSLVGAKQPS